MLLTIKNKTLIWFLGWRYYGKQERNSFAGSVTASHGLWLKWTIDQWTKKSVKGWLKSLQKFRKMENKAFIGMNRRQKKRLKRMAEAKRHIESAKLDNGGQNSSRLPDQP